MSEGNFGERWLEQNIYPSPENPKTIAEDKEEKKSEATKIYENSSDDPAVIETEGRILSITNKEVTETEKGRWGKDKSEEVRRDYGGVWSRINRKVEMDRWDDFVKKYPEKAQAYKDFEPIAEALARQTKLEEKRDKGEEN